MIPVGYMAKRVATRPDWLETNDIVDIYSVSNCVSRNFADYVQFWMHNGYWFFDSPEILMDVARQHSIDLSGTKLFFYEAYEQQYDDNERRWSAFEPEPSFTTQVILPAHRTLEGYDVVSFYVKTSPECSPLSCNSLARDVPTNEHCLLRSFDHAKQLLEDGKFAGSEPGPYRVFAVYSVDWRAA